MGYCRRCQRAPRSRGEYTSRRRTSRSRASGKGVKETTPCTEETYAQVSAMNDAGKGWRRRWEPPPREALRLTPP
eukprot:9285547-Heterocapsa_arctica.AAC.1